MSGLRSVRLLAAILTGLLALPLLVPVMPALAAPLPPLSLSEAVRALQAYGIVDERPEAEMRLGDPITRAEFARVLGAAMGESELAARLVAEPAFPDTGGHWANGWIAATRARGLFLGREDGHFYPEAPVTHAEALTALLRLTGRPAEAARDWPWGAVLTALELRIIPADSDVKGRFTDVATRGHVFRYTAAAIGRVPTSGTGVTLLQSLRDQRPPVLSLSGFPATSSQRSLTARGHAGDAVSVSVGGRRAEILPDGSFSIALDLEPGENRFEVIAIDGAGNRAEAAASISYVTTARLEVRPAQIAAAVGHPFEVPVFRVDTAGRAVAARELSWGYDTGALSRDETTGRFTASRSGEFTVRAYLEGHEAAARVVVAGEPAGLQITADHPVLVAGGSPTALRIAVVDAQGRLSPAGSHQVQVSVLPQGAATLDMASVTTREGTAVVYLAPGVNPGGFGVQAKATGATPFESPLLAISVEARRLAGVRLSVTPPNLEPSRGRQIQVIATAVDQIGSPMAVEEELRVTVSSSDPAVASLTRAVAVIPPGASTSEYRGENGLAVSGGGAGQTTITGRGAGLPVEAAVVTAVRAGAIARLDARLVQEVALADEMSAAVVAVTRLDATGLPVVGDRNGVVLIPRTGNASISLLSDEGGVATFAVRSATAGRVAMTAGLPGRPELNSEQVQVAFIQAQGRGGRALLKVSAPSARAGESVEVFVSLVNNAGAPLPNPGPPLIYRVQSGPGGTLAGSEVVIAPGASQSGRLTLNVAMNTNNVALSGSMVGGKALPGAFVSVLPPLLGPVQPIAGLHLIAVGPGAERSPTAGEEARFVIVARDGSEIQRGSYAFRIKVKLDGKELQSLPENLQVSIGKRSVMETTGRTINGEAHVWVRYTGTGVVEIEPVRADAHWQAYDHFGVVGQGLATTGYASVKGGQVRYVAGSLDRMEVRVDPALGGQYHAIIKAGRGRMATVSLRAVDLYGNPAGAGCTAALIRLGAQPADSFAIRAGSQDLAEHQLALAGSGEALFTVVSLTEQQAASEWLPKLVCAARALTGAQNVRVSSTLTLAATPVIQFAGGDVSRDGRVAKADSYLEVRIAQTAGSASEVAELLVYDGDTLLGQFGPVYPGQSNGLLRTVKVPKALLGTSSRMVLLRLRLHTGADVSDVSEDRWIYFTLLD